METKTVYVKKFVEYFSDKPSVGYVEHYVYGETDRCLCGVRIGRVCTVSDEKPDGEIATCPTCWAMKDASVTYFCNRAGQERRYGDTRYDFTITAQGWIPSDSVVYGIAQMIHKALPKEKAHPLVDSVLEFKQVTRGIWKYVTGHDYTD